MRRLHGAPQRGADPLLRHPGRRGRGRGDHHHRRGVARRSSSRAARLGRAGRGAVWLLPVRTDHGGRSADRRQTGADGRRYRCRDDGEYLPLRHLSAHPRRCAPRRGAGERGRAMRASASPSRREFLKTSAALSGALVIAFVAPDANPSALPQVRPSRQLAPNAFLRVGSDDTVTVLLAHSEMGQGVWTALPMLIAEELDADWSTIRVEHAGAAPVYAHTAFGMQMTGGSTSTRSEFDRYRQPGATARALMVAAAAQRFRVNPADCRTEHGAVIAGKQRARYGTLAAAAAQLPPPKPVPLKDPKDWKLIGKPTKRLDTPEKITGRAQFGIDVRFPGLLVAVVARPPGFGATVTSFDATAAKAVPGRRHVVHVPGGGAVVAQHFCAAKRA